ncbi:type IV pilus modification protein PilV [Solimonas soli]|uniref:type IV pilus modification protein PilV n=1 Tax=Solimonas soli TaxID=413479 RepID=UPI000489318B|nr:type IV pilus modification protein PilV [Solimonas soli]
MRAGRYRQKGVGLIEVLVAVLILSIGLLGIALVQTRSLSGNNSSMARSMAVVASYSILEAMRADRANALGGSYNKTVAGNNCNAVTSSALAQERLRAWCANQLAAQLGAAATTTGVISCTAGGVCTVTITYDDSRGIGPASGSSAATAYASSSTQTVVTQAAL